jgi:hypothetical protein
MKCDLTFYLFAWVVLMLLALLCGRFWQGGQRAPAVPQPPKGKRDPQPFAGYTRRPECELCEQQVQSLPQAPGAPPRMRFTRGRRRQVDTTLPAHHLLVSRPGRLR